MERQTKGLGTELTTSKDALLTFVSGLHLKSIELLSLTSEKKNGFALPATITTEPKTKLEREEDGAANILCHYSVRAIPKGANAAKASMRVLAVYSVSYTFDGRLSDESRSFLKQNALMTSWPYFRHVVQTATSDMGLPPLTIDLVRTTDKPSKRRNTSSEE